MRTPKKIKISLARFWHVYSTLSCTVDGKINKQIATDICAVPSIFVCWLGFDLNGYSCRSSDPEQECVRRGRLSDAAFYAVPNKQKAFFREKKTQAYNRRRFQRKLSNWLFDFARFNFSRCQQHNIVLLSVMSIRIALKLSFRKKKKMNKNSI